MQVLEAVHKGLAPVMGSIVTVMTLRRGLTKAHVVWWQERLRAAANELENLK